MRNIDYVLERVQKFHGPDVAKDVKNEIAEYEKTLSRIEDRIKSDDIFKTKTVTYVGYDSDYSSFRAGDRDETFTYKISEIVDEDLKKLDSITTNLELSYFVGLRGSKDTMIKFKETDVDEINRNKLLQYIEELKKQEVIYLPDVCE